MNDDALGKEFFQLINQLEEFYIFGDSHVAKHIFRLVVENNKKDCFKGFIVSRAVSDDSLFGYSVFRVEQQLVQQKNVLMSTSEIAHPETFSLIKDNGGIPIPCYKFFNLSINDDFMYPYEHYFNTNMDLTEEEKRITEEVYEIIRFHRISFGQDMFYQSYSQLGILGIRPTDYRIEQYELYNYLNKDSEILDIGCNVGFLDLTIAPYVKRIVGIEIDTILTSISNCIKRGLQIDNVFFVNKNFIEYKQTIQGNQFNVIFSFAVHVWVDISPEEYVNDIGRLLRGGGIVIFESQTLETDKEYDRYVSLFQRKHINTIKVYELIDDGINRRRVTVLKKDVECNEEDSIDNCSVL